jgi:DNA-binding transcriptional MerR regulator
MSVQKSTLIGDLARRTGTKINTIRFYEDIGLMPKADRTEAGRRTYAEVDFRRLSFIRHSRGLGFSIDEIRSLMALSDQPDQDCAEAATIARRHLNSIKDRIERLEALQSQLTTIATSCSGGRAADCSVIEAIAGIGRASQRLAS